MKTEKVLQVPGKDQYCKIDKNGVTVLPSGRYITMAGQVIPITNDPYGLAISPDGQKAVTLHDGVITLINLRDLNAQRIPSYDKKIPSPFDQRFLSGSGFCSGFQNMYT